MRKRVDKVSKIRKRMAIKDCYMKDKINKKVLVVASGGMDSTVALAKAVNDYEYVEVVSFKYGSNHHDRAYAALEKTCIKYGVKLMRIDLDFIRKYFKSSSVLSIESLIALVVSAVDPIESPRPVVSIALEKPDV